MTFRIFGKVNFTPATKVEWFADALRDAYPELVEEVA